MYKLDNTHIPVISIIDNLSLHESLHSTNVTDGKRLYTDICPTCNMFSRNRISEVKLTSSQDQLADCLTKGTASTELLMQVTAGEVDLRFLLSKARPLEILQLKIWYKAIEDQMKFLRAKATES